MPTLTGFGRVPLPGPRPVPLLGSLPRLFRFLDDPVAVMVALREHGEIAAVARNDPALVCAFGAELNRQVLTKPDVFRHDEGLFRGAPGSSIARISQMIVCINGDRHKRHRRLMAPAFSKSALPGYADSIVEVAEAMVQRWPRGQRVDLDALLRDLALCMAVRALFGIDMTQDSTALGTLAADFAGAVTNPLAFLLPVDLPLSPYRRALRLGDQLLAGLEELIAVKRARTEPEHDALALLLHAVDDDGTGFSDEELMPEVVALFFAGYETTAKTLSWTLFLLERHPEVLARVLEEVDGALGGRSVTADDIPRMPLLDAVVKESMRLLPSVPALFFRVPATEVELRGVTLPQGCNVVLSPYVCHREPSLYPEPQRFHPDRWEGLEPSPYEYLPFGAGPRTCIGAAFSRQAIRLVLPTVLQRVRFSLVRGATIDRLTRASIMMPKHGLPAVLDEPHRRTLAPEPIRGNVQQMVDLVP